MRHRNKIIMGSAIGLAAIAVAIDHTRHHVPEPALDETRQQIAQHGPQRHLQSDARGQPDNNGGQENKDAFFLHDGF